MDGIPRTEFLSLNSYLLSAISLSVKEGRTTMKRIIALILLIITAASCAACQPTPEADVVQSKSNGELERKLTADPVEAAYGKLPESIYEKIDGKQEEVTIYVNADVKAPPVVQIPVKEYEILEYSVEELKQFTEYFLQGSEPYKVPTQLTKAQLLERIKKVESQLNENFLDEYYGNDEETKAEMREIWGMEYDMLRQYYDEAPETVEHELPEYDYVPSVDYMDQATYADNYAFAYYNVKHNIPGAQKDFDRLTKQNGEDRHQLVFRCLGDLDGGYTGFVSAAKVESDRAVGTGFYFNRGKVMKNGVPVEIQSADYVGAPLTISEDKARKYVEDALKTLGIFDEYELETHEYSYQELNDAAFHFFRYRRKLADGIAAVDYFFNLAPQSEVQYEETRPRLDSEYVCAWVDDDGIACFRIEAPLRETQTVNTSVELMKFEDVYDVFKQYAVLHYDNIESITEYEDGEQYIQYSDETEIRIREIYLAGIRIVKKNDISRYLIVPVWIFKGTRKDIYTLGGDVNSHGQITSVIINAIDGTIINPNDCY